MKKKIVIIAAIVSMISCGKKESPILPEVPKQKTFGELAKAEWLIGTWENNSAQGNLIETWSRKNDSVFSGVAYFIMNKDTAFSETIELAEQNGKLVYIATVSTQNDGKPVLFPATSANEDELTFENQQHDYPKKIIYKKVLEDSLIATIEGVEKGTPKSERFSMKKTK